MVKARPVYETYVIFVPLNVHLYSRQSLPQLQQTNTYHKTLNKCGICSSSSLDTLNCTTILLLSVDVLHLVPISDISG